MKNGKDQLLKQALREVMKEELEQVPDTKDIQALYQFRKSFEDKMNGLLEKKKKRFWRRNSWYFGLAAAACCLVLLLIVNKNSMKEQMYDSGAADDMGKADGTASEEAIPPDDVGYGAKKAEEAEEIQEEEQEVEQKEEIVIRAEQQKYQKDDKLILIIENNSSKTITFGTYYKLEGFINGEWEEVETKQEAAFTDIEIILEAGETTEEEIYLSLYRFDEKYEKYRIVKEINGVEREALFMVE